MTTANFEETPPPELPPRGFRRPADYYSSASPQSVLPQWVSLGCGGLATLALIVIFAASFWISSSGFGQFIDMTLGMSLGEMRGMYAKDITESDKKELEAEVERMRGHLREERIATTKLQPFLQALSRSTRDGSVTAQEVEQITAEAAKINRTAPAAKPAPAPAHRSGAR
ncbi:MAG TPA: hypothetical protein VGF48_00430 [Thermoanaerobaculia bacterium]|jgi:hypothetical protein